jgi:cation:H+ antiporter
MATLRGERDMAVGNVVGSNLFNLLFVLGSAAIVAPDAIAVPEAAMAFDFPVMLAASAACLPIFFIGHSIQRWEGAVFLAYYVAYVTYLVLSSTDSQALPMFSRVMLGFVIPLTVMTFLVFTWRYFRKRSKGV